MFCEIIINYIRLKRNLGLIFGKSFCYFYNMKKQPLLEVNALEISFKKDGGFKPIINSISYALQSNEILG
ncbi:MAG: hypothetical protein DI548_03300, partial [Flavobacterium johnsoniae]